MKVPPEQGVGVGVGPHRDAVRVPPRFPNEFPSPITVALSVALLMPGRHGVPVSHEADVIKIALNSEPNPIDVFNASSSTPPSGPVVQPPSSPV